MVGLRLPALISDDAADGADDVVLLGAYDGHVSIYLYPCI